MSSARTIWRAPTNFARKRARFSPWCLMR